MGVHLFAYEDPIVLVPFIEKAVFPPLNYFCNFCTFLTFNKAITFNIKEITNLAKCSYT